MLDENSNEFFKELGRWVRPEHEKLIGQSLTLQLQIQEIEFLEWALKTFESQQVLQEIIDSMEDLVCVDKKVATSEIQATIDEGRKKLKRYAFVIEQLRRKMASAIDTASREAEKQMGLNLNHN